MARRGQQVIKVDDQARRPCACKLGVQLHQPSRRIAYLQTIKVLLVPQITHHLQCLGLGLLLSKPLESRMGFGIGQFAFNQVGKRALLGSGLAIMHLLDCQT